MPHTATHRSRGLRNNNPGNIRHGGSPWYGVAAQQTDTAFLQFSEMKWGVRALARTLLTYANQRQAGDGSPIDTLAEVITRWAPPSENNTAAYITSVARATGFQPNDTIDLNDNTTLRAVTKAIMRHENGSDPVDDNQLADAVDLASINAD